MADSTQYAKYTGISGAGGGVTSLNSLTGALTLVGGTGITITPSGSSITIASTSAGDVTLTAFGSAPNADGASLTGQALTLQPADGTHPGGVSTLAQTFGGSKTFAAQTLFSNGSVGAPALAFTNDTTSGMYLVGAGDLSFAIAGTKVLDMQKSAGGFGNLGIGENASTSDSYPLLIQRDVASAGVVMQISNIDTAANSFSALQCFSDNGNVGAWFASYDSESTVPPYVSSCVIRSSNSGHHLTLMGGENSGDDVGIWTNGDFTATGQLMNFNADKSVSFMQQISTPATPSTGQAKLYQKSDGRLYQMSAAGTERILGSSDTTGTVTAVSVASANGFAGTSSGGATPALTLTTSITGLLQGNGTAISAATTGNLTDTGTDGIVITGGTGAVLGSGTSIAQTKADGSHNGYLSSADWTTFNGKGAGTVTSVAISVPASSLFGTSGSPVTTSGTLGLTTTGTSGGIPYFDTTSTLNSSALLVTNGIVLGKGAGAAPATLATNASTAFPLVSGGTNTAPSWAGLTVAGGGTSLTSGTSGGIPYFSSTSAMTSSALLTANGVVYGGGAGSAPVATAAGTTGQALVATTSAAPAWGAVGTAGVNTATFTAPTRTALSSGSSGTYTVPTSPRLPLYIMVYMWGGGGGGGGSGTAGSGVNGGNGTDTTFRDWTAGHGTGGSSGNGGLGGSTTIGTGTRVIDVKGGDGQGGAQANGANIYLSGGVGGSTAFGNPGGGNYSSNPPNTGTIGSGGTGGGVSASSNTYAGGGGGAGAFIQMLIPNPSGTYTYTVGVGGTSGTAGTSGVAGAVGGTAQIIVIEYYQ